MSQINIYATDEAEFTISYEKDGKQMTWTGTAQVRIDQEADYDEIPVDNWTQPLLAKTAQRTTVTLEYVRDFKGRLKEKRNDMEKVVTTRKILVEDFTFASISKARKKVGAPKESTFKTYDGIDDEFHKEKSVTFTWQETV